jgi:hypothetical protein
MASTSNAAAQLKARREAVLARPPIADRRGAVKPQTVEIWREVVNSRYSAEHQFLNLEVCFQHTVYCSLSN